MTGTRILHFADLHLDVSTRDNAEHAMGQILGVAREFRPHLIVNAGDLSMRRGHLAPWVSAMLREWHCQLAEVAPVVVVAGNHDLSYSDAVGTVAGALSFSDASDEIVLAEIPRVIDFGAGFLQVACLPYPSRYMLQSIEPGISAQEVNARAGDLLGTVLRGLAAEAGPGSILVFHGSLSGARTSSEIEMTTDMDVVIPETAIPEEFAAVLCGHIHRHQRIGRAVYAGSPCPLNFGEDHEHGVVLWEDGEPRFLELEPKHRLVTVDWQSWEDGAAYGKRRDGRPDGYRGAKVRVLVTVPRGGDVDRMMRQARAVFDDAAEVRFQIEHAPEDRTVETGDVRQGLSHDELLQAFAGRSPDAEPYLDDLRHIFAEVDGQLPPEARALEQFAEYRLLRAACRNWKSLEAAEVEFDSLGRLVVVEGENATGKSNLMEIESFAVWGRLPRGKPALADLVRNGEQEMWVEAEFAAAGERWKARRTVRLNSKGVGVGDLVLQRLPAVKLSREQVEELKAAREGAGAFEPTILPPDQQWGWESANAGTATETQRLIEQMVGPYDLYLATRYASQGDIDRLLDMTPAELKDALQGALGTKAFEAREAIAKKALAEAQARCARFSSTIEALESQVSQAAEVEQGLARAREDLEAATAIRAGAEEALEGAAGALEEAKLAAAAVEADREKRAGITRRIEVHRTRIVGLERELAGCREVVKHSDGAREKLARLDALRERLAGLEVDETAHRALVDVERQAREAREAAGREAKQAAEEVARLEEKYRGKLEALQARQEGQRRTIEAKIQAARDGAALIGKAPWGEKCVAAPCPLLGAAVAQRDRIGPLERELAEVYAAVATEAAGLRDQYRAADTGLREAAATAQDKLAPARARHGEAQRELAASTYDPGVANDVRREIAGIRERELRAAEAAANEAQGRAVALEGEIAELAAQAEALAGELAAVPEPAPVDLGPLTAEVDRLKRALASARTAESGAREAVAGGEGKLEMLAGAREKLAAAEKDRELASREATARGIFARAMGRDGLPYLILERAIPALEAHANAVLGAFDERLEIEPCRDLRSGEQKSEVHVRFRDRFGAHPLNAASGKQRAVIGVALRAALSHVQAETHGLRVSCWICDEGFAALDESSQLGAQQLLHGLATLFDRVIFVSHMPAIREVADTRIRVCANGATGSVVELVA